MKVAIMQRMLCKYQLAFFTLLKENMDKINIEMKVFYGFIEGYRHEYKNSYFEQLPYIKFNVRVGGLQEKLVLLPSLLWAFMDYKPDVIITEDISAMPNCITVFVYSKLFKVPYVIWGGGAIPKKKPSKLKLFLKPLIELFRKNAKAFLCYSSYAKDYYCNQSGKKYYIAYNSTTLKHTELQYKEIETAIYKKYRNLNQMNMVFIGRLIPQKRMDILLSAISMLNVNIPVFCHIIGDGNIRNKLMEQSNELGITKQVRFWGEVTDSIKKTDIFMNAHLGILPGLGGLAIQEMMWHGIPVIASSADGTEMDLIVDGKGGIYVEEMNAKNLCESIGKFICMEEDEKITIALNGLKVIDNKYNMNSMVNAFAESIIQNV